MTNGTPNEMRFSFFFGLMNDEGRVTNDEGSPNAQKTIKRTGCSLRHSDFVIRHSSFVIAEMACGNRFLRAQLLQSNWVTRGEAASVATINVPTGADIATVTQVGRVEAQAGDDGEGVAFPGIDRYPFAGTAFAVAAKLG